MIIFPAIDIIDGKCVRLTQGRYDLTKVYDDNPLEIARGFAKAGLTNLHLVDLDGARAGKVTNWDTVRAICSAGGMTVDFGGGVKTREEVAALLECGVSQVNLGSIAVRNPELVAQWTKEFGPDRFIISADVRNEVIAINGWQHDTDVSVFDLIKKYVALGHSWFTCTDIATDGMLTGPNISLYEKILKAFPAIRLIASGGVAGVGDVTALRQVGAAGVIIGKALYEGKISLEELTKR